MEFRVLGALEVREGSRQLDLGGPRQRTLLAHLLLRANHLVPTERLIDALWGDHPPASPRGSLQAYVSRLRRVLGDGRLEGRSGGYVLHVGDDEADLSRFERLVALARASAPADAMAAAALYTKAVDIWRGPALDDLASEPSLLADRERLDELRVRVTEERVRSALAAGAHAELVPELEALTARYPLREGLWADLMVAQYRSGRQAEALAAFRRVRQVLADELGIEPSPFLHRLHGRVLEQDPSLASPTQPLRGYEVHGELGRGAFGVVHRATQPQVGREVAIKVIRGELADHPAFIRAFEVEAQLVAQLEHPHIVPLYDYWREPAGAFLVMRHLAGGSLRDRIDADDVVDVAAMVEQVGGALAFAHRRGVVHGDIKPANILFDGEGNAFLTDFAIAYDGAGVSIAGSSSPEGLRGEPLTPRTDVYCLGLAIREAAKVDPSWELALAPAVRRATAADPETRHTSVEALVAEVLAVLRGPARVAGPVVVERNPFKGLRPFLESDADDFYGRDEVVAGLVERLAAPGPAGRFLAVVGPSGAGKSSLVRAGLIPALRAGAVPSSESWFYLDMVPGRDPFARLAAAIQRVATFPTIEVETHHLAGGGGLDAVLDRALGGHPALLLIDQFEELFTLVDEEEVRVRFLRQILDTADDPAGTTRVVVTVRADHLDQPLRYPRLAELLQHHAEFAVPLGPDEVAQVVTRPAARVGLAVEPEFVARITSDFLGQPGSLPLLQFALTELFEHRDGARLSVADYVAAGGLAAVLTRRADATFASLDPVARDAARQLFLRLVAVGDGPTRTRRRVSLTELRTVAGSASTMDAAVDAFGSARLLTFDRDPETRDPTVEIAHEALLVHWGRFVTWTDTAREDLRIHRRLARAVGDWAESGRDASFLATGANLEQFWTLRQTSTLVLTPYEQEFLDTSRDAESEQHQAAAARQARERLLERRSLRRARALVAALAVGALVAAGLSAVAFRERGDARTHARLATARALVAGSSEHLDRDPELALLLALAGVEQTRGGDGAILRDAEQALHDAIGVASRIDRVLPRSGGRVSWDPTSELVAVQDGGDPAVIRLLDPATGEQHGAVEHGAEVFGLAFSPDGSLLATGGSDGTLRLWDTGTTEQVAALDGPQDEVRGPSFSPDGTMVAASWQDAGQALVWDVRSGARVASIEVDAQTGGTSFSPDGTRLLVMAMLPDAAGVVLDVDEVVTRVTVPPGQAELFRLQGELSILWSPEGTWSRDGRWIASAPGSVWDGETGELADTIGPPPGPSTVPVAEDVAWSPVGGRLVTVQTDGDTVVWDAVETPFEPLLRLPGGTTLSDVAVSSTGGHVLTGDTRRSTARIWDVTPLGSVELANVESAPVMAAEGLAISPDGSRMADHAGDGDLRVRDTATLEEVWRVPAHRAFVLDDGSEVLTVPNIEWSADGTLIATGGADRTAVWDADTGALRFAVDLEPFVMLPALHPDGQYVAVHRPRDLAVFDHDGNEVAVLPLPPDILVEGLAFSPDGDRLVVAQYTWPPDHEFEVVVWDWRDEEIVRTLSTEAWNIGLSPTGTLLVTADRSGVAEVWDWDRGELIRRLGSHPEGIQHAQFNADGTLIATGGFDGTVRIWDADSGAQLLRLGDFEWVNRVRFDPHGRWVAAIGPIDTHHVIRFFTLDLDDLVEIGRDHVTRGLTEAECRRYLPPEWCRQDRLG